MTSERELDWIDGFSRNLVHRAAQRAPETLSERLEEEWLADMAERRGSFSRLRLAVGCYWAIYAIAREHSVAAREQSVATVAAAGPRVAQVNFAGYAQETASLFSGRSATFLLVAALHATAHTQLEHGDTRPSANKGVAADRAGVPATRRREGCDDRAAGDRRAAAAPRQGKPRSGRTGKRVSQYGRFLSQCFDSLGRNGCRGGQGVRRQHWAPHFRSNPCPI